MHTQVFFSPSKMRNFVSMTMVFFSPGKMRNFVSVTMVSASASRILVRHNAEFGVEPSGPGGVNPGGVSLKLRIQRIQILQRGD